jgi:hypothetical protein
MLKLKSNMKCGSWYSIWYPQNACIWSTLCLNPCYLLDTMEDEMMGLTHRCHRIEISWTQSYNIKTDWPLGVLFHCTACLRYTCRPLPALCTTAGSELFHVFHVTSIFLLTAIRPSLSHPHACAFQCLLWLTSFTHSPSLMNIGCTVSTTTIQ